MYDDQPIGLRDYILKAKRSHKLRPLRYHSSSSRLFLGARSNLFNPFATLCPSPTVDDTGSKALYESIRWHSIVIQPSLEPPRTGILTDIRGGIAFQELRAFR